ncbi:MAG: hypothetical protein WCD73_18890 [Pseudolabrys sp.]
MNIAIAESAAHPQHRADTLQKNIPAFGRERGGRVHDGSKLIIGQGDHPRHSGATAASEQRSAGDGGGDDLPRPREISSEKLATCHCQRRNLPHVIIGKAPAWLQHCAAPFQKDRTALDRHGVRSGRDDFKLMIAERNHAPDDSED